MKKVLVVLGLIVLGGVVIWGVTARGGNGESTYRLVEIERGDVESVISSTGTLQATTTVQVGTQVSGKVAEILVDFNDRVRRDQLIARIDPTIWQQEVRAAEANLKRSQAELDQAQHELERTQGLYDRELAAESEYSTAEYKHAAAQAARTSAQVSLERAQQSLSYTEIRAPVDGVVLERNVDVGQTVAASLSAPQLFLIAEDLSQMEILASVDESDIGQIREGQEVRFTVQAYPDELFPGSVRQVRLQSRIQENVVNYTVVVTVGNPDGRLLPGMTATVEFLIDRATDVLKIANAALRFRPTEEMMNSLRERRTARPDPPPPHGRRGPPGRPHASLVSGRGRRRERHPGARRRHRRPIHGCRGARYSGRDADHCRCRQIIAFLGEQPLPEPAAARSPPRTAPRNVRREWD